MPFVWCDCRMTKVLQQLTKCLSMPLPTLVTRIFRKDNHMTVSIFVFTLWSILSPARLAGVEFRAWFPHLQVLGPVIHYFKSWSKCNRTTLKKMWSCESLREHPELSPLLSEAWERNCQTELQSDVPWWPNHYQVYLCKTVYLSSSMHIAMHGLLYKYKVIEEYLVAIYIRNYANLYSPVIYTQICLLMNDALYLGRAQGHGRNALLSRSPAIKIVRILFLSTANQCNCAHASAHSCIIRNNLSSTVLHIEWICSQSLRLQHVFWGKPLSVGPVLWHVNYEVIFIVVSSAMKTGTST